MAMEGNARRVSPPPSIAPVSENDASQILESLGKKPAPPPEDARVEELKLLQHDLASAGEIQAKLLPERLPMISGYEFDTFYSPAGELGGDFYDFIQFDKRNLGILVADASGKGLSGSLLMVEARAVIRAMASLSASPADILLRANRVLLQDLRRGMFITLFYALLTRRSARSRWPAPATCPCSCGGGRRRNASP